MNTNTDLNPVNIAQQQQDLWDEIHQETQTQADHEPILASFLHATVLKHKTLPSALSFLLAYKLDSPTASALLLREVIEEAMAADTSILEAVTADIVAIRDRDSACTSLSTPFLYFKGFHAIQSWRISHWLWTQGREAMALFLQNRISEVFAVDIHPAAKLGKGLMLDHATGVVIGATAVVADNVSIMQSVTLGGTGKEEGDRHPKIAAGVLISAGAKVLGNIHVGEGAQIGPGSVVLKDVPAHTTVCGVPAKSVGCPQVGQPALAMNHAID